MAPEQIERARVDGRADVYSLGCVLYQCLTGQVPYPGDRLLGVLWAHVNAPPPSARALRPELPASLDAVLARALAKDPITRYSTCGEFVEAARNALPVSEQASRPSGRRLRRVLVAAAAGAAAAALAFGLVLARGGGGSSVAGGNSSDPGTIVIGLAAAKTGFMVPYDLQPAEAFTMRIDEINAGGGVLGKQIKVEWLDTKSKLTRRNAETLIARGAVAIVAPCDYDAARPAFDVARHKRVAVLSLCASAPSAATPAFVGPYGGSMGEGADSEGASMAEWLRTERPRWKRAYVLEDISFEYGRAIADYFVARWRELDGTISAEDTLPPFMWSTPAAIDASAQVTRLRRSVKQADVIYLASNGPAVAHVIRQMRAAGIHLPIASSTGLDGTFLRDFAGNASNVYAMGIVCIPSYCSGAVTPSVERFFDSFFEKYGTVPINSFSTRGYDLATALVEAIKRAKSTDGAKIAKALFSGVRIKTLAGPVEFTAKCHRPQPPSHIFELYTNGKAKALGRVYTRKIPTIGDGNPCTGIQATPVGVGVRTPSPKPARLSATS
jgi:branched-chain amino acid transport system substrate-binding protein